MLGFGKSGGFPLSAGHRWEHVRGRRCKWFVSHAYKDAAAIEALRCALPKVIEPVIFPPIEVPPERAVSDALIHAIRACEGLVFIDQQASAQSFWVNFERRFALRTGKPVLAFSPERSAFTSYAPSVGNTAAILWNPAAAEDARLGPELARWLSGSRRVYTERLFETWYERDPANYVTIPTVALEQQFGEDVYSIQSKVSKYDAAIVIVASNTSLQQSWPFKDSETLAFRELAESRPPHVEVVWLDPPSTPEIGRAFAERGPTPEETILRERLLKSAQSDAPLVVARNGEINWNRADDLLVRLEHAAFQRGSKDGPDRSHALRQMWMSDDMNQLRQSRF